MNLSVFDIYSVGIGPSSSHTVGPMKAAKDFMDRLMEHGLYEQTQLVSTALYGSLALTGKGHGTDTAIILGLSGHTPEEICPDRVDGILERANKAHKLEFYEDHKHAKIVDFNPREHILFHRSQTLDFHSNGMCFQAIDKNGKELFKKVYYSIGGGFIIAEGENNKGDIFSQHESKVKYPFTCGDELLSQAKKNNLTICELIKANEKSWRTEDEINTGMLAIWDAMNSCIKRGLKAEGQLPGGLKVNKRAKKLHAALLKKDCQKNLDPLTIMDWVNLFAISVNEENASGGKVVTAPTNGAAGIIPAVVKYYLKFVKDATIDKVIDFLLVAGAIGVLYKKNASISGAEVGCQGEVGVACSMAAAGLAQVLGGTNEQIENAAEIAMEHNLGLTCDPIGGLVQIPCIERNAMGAVKAINAARMAMRGDGSHYVSLDKVIKTMKDTGADMQTKYKETSRGGLAVNVTEC
ncbi:L-serine ammonia-lyase [Halobacteriovorax sp. DPLXC-1]|uniref:L-serine ammonia-lyase n=1 Tax=Halobacteriovorax sp. DPLXC-1 TaxID=3110771 RepID=UPI002FEF6111